MKIVDVISILGKPAYECDSYLTYGYKEIVRIDEKKEVTGWENFEENKELAKFFDSPEDSKKIQPPIKKEVQQAAPVKMASEKNFCPKCGIKLSGEEAYCSKCGLKLDNSQVLGAQTQVSKSDTGDDMLKFLNDKIFYLGNVSGMDFQTEYAKVCSEIKYRIEKHVDSEKYIPGDFAASALIIGIVYELIMPHAHRVFLGQFSEFLGQDPLGAGMIMGMGGNQQFVNYMGSLMIQVSNQFTSKQSFFKLYSRARVLNEFTKLREVKEKKGGKTVSRSIVFEFNYNLKEFKSVYVFVIGSGNKGGTPFNDGNYFIYPDNCIQLNNVSVYGTGIGFMAIGLK
jgi:hypothetical protein